MGFQDMVDVVHKAASAKGGRIKKAKGLAMLSPEKRREIASMGGKAKHENNKSQKGAKQTQASDGGDSPKLADLLGTLDEKEL